MADKDSLAARRGDGSQITGWWFTLVADPEKMTNFMFMRRQTALIDCPLHPLGCERLSVPVISGEISFQMNRNEVRGIKWKQLSNLLTLSWLACHLISNCWSLCLCWITFCSCFFFFFSFKLNIIGTLRKMQTPNVPGYIKKHSLDEPQLVPDSDSCLGAGNDACSWHD